MKRKKIVILFLIAILFVGLLFGCSSDVDVKQPPSDSKDENTKTPNNNSTEVPENTSQETGKYDDGIYFAQEKGFNEETGWKYVVTLEVKDGKIVAADWNGANAKGGLDKDSLSESGQYGLYEKGGAQAPWYKQAQAAEAYLLETQDPTKIEYSDEEGHTDAISGASIHVKEFFTLAEEALANGPVGKGPYKDGAYHAEEPEFAESGWKYFVDLTVINGNIVAADWNGLNKEGGDDKDTLSMNGQYGLYEKGGAQAPWYKQAQAAEAYLLETQDPTKIEYSDEEGHTDAISGASIHVKEFFTLAEEALKEAK